MIMTKAIIRNIWERMRCYRDANGNMHSRWWMYPCYIKWRLTPDRLCHGPIEPNQYFTAVPNRGAGIGHQISNWQSGLWFSWQFGLKHAHVPFAQNSWDRFLGYGDGEPTLQQLKAQGYKIVRLPLFDDHNQSEMGVVKQMFSLYAGRKVVFVAEQDQHYPDQYGVQSHIQKQFFASPVRESDLTPYNDEHFNIAVHLRRGDIVIGQTNGDPNLTMRWLSNDYYTNVLDNILPLVKKQTAKPVHIYIFSQGKKTDFTELEKYDNVHFYLDLNPESTFLSFVYADLLITSKSSFSYKPALLNRDGIKVCPQNFWHAYPNDEKWIMMDDEGQFMSEGERSKLLSLKS